MGVNNEVEHEADHGVRVKDAMENEDRNVKTAVFIARLKKMFCIIYSKAVIRNYPINLVLEVCNPHYILDLLLSIINVGLKTVEIVKGLPGIKYK